MVEGSDSGQFVDADHPDRTTHTTMDADEQRTTDGVSRRRYLELAAAGGGGLVIGTGSADAARGHANRDVTIRSDESTAPVDLAATVYRPAGASRVDPVPVILHSHGWGGSRTSSDGAFRTELDAGFGVLSFDQRGWGESGGQAHVQEPDREGEDVIALLDYVADLEWVARTRRDGTPIPAADDPMAFAMGRSYGGGYQLVGALTETAQQGYTRFDALAPQITWYDLPGSLAPEGVPRTLWLAVLEAVGAGSVPRYVHEAFAYSAATGQWPDGEPPGEPDLDATFADNGTVGFVEDGVRLDAPVLFGQGLPDNLFNFNQAWKNFERGLTDDARARSAVVGYDAGHTLPSAVPPGTTVPANPAASPASFARRRLRFFEAVRDGDGDARSVVGSPYLLTTASGERRVAVDSVDDRTRFGGVDLAVRGDGEGGLAVADVAAPTSGRVDAAASTTGIGAPVHLPLAAGPLTVAGVATLSASVTTAGVDQRLFLALSKGRTPATARILQNNVMPLHEPAPVDGVDRTVELPGAAADVESGERLYLTLSAVSEMFLAHGSVRSPGTVVLEDLSVGVPLTEN